MTPGPMGFMGPVGFRGPIEMSLRNQLEDRRPFFWRSHQNPETTVAFSSSVLDAQNRRCLIFELTPS